MFGKLKEIEDRFDYLESEMVRPDVIQDQRTYQKYLKEHSHLSPIVESYRRYQSTGEEIENNRPLLEDPDPDNRWAMPELIHEFSSEETAPPSKPVVSR